MERRTVVHVVLGLQLGGLERLICNLTASPELAEFKVVVCCMDEEGVLADEVRRAGGRVLMLKRSAGLDVQSLLRLTAFFHREQVAAVHTHSIDPMLYAGWAARLAGVPVRIHTQHLDLLGDTYSNRDRMKFRLAAKALTAIVSITRQIDAGLASAGISEGKRHIIFNGIDENRFRCARDHVVTGEVTHEFRIGVSARLAPQKGLSYLLEAFAQVHHVEPATRLVIAGDGPLRRELEKQAQALGIARAVEFLGFQANVEAFLNSLDLFVLPSLFEGLPLALLEAMAARLPVIATAVDGIPEVIVNGESGVLVAPKDALTLRDAMLNLVRDPHLRSRLGLSAETQVHQRFGIRTMARAYRSLYLLAERSAGWKKIAKKLMGMLPTKLLVWSGGRRDSKIAVTFDDGPDPLYTPQILAALRRCGGTATFFVIGEKVDLFPHILKQILEGGHEIGNHSHSHPDFSQLSWHEATRELAATTSTITAIQGRPCRLFRPPKGKLCLTSLVPAWIQGMAVVMWNVDLKDFCAGSPDDIKQTLSSNPLQPGDIVLYHGNTDASIEALPHVLEAVMKNGSRLASVSDLLGQ